MSHVTSSTEPGWRPDPSGRYEWRYWDGGWTNRVANSTVPSDAAAAVPPSPPVAAYAPDAPAAVAPAAAVPAYAAAPSSVPSSVPGPVTTGFAAPAPMAVPAPAPQPESVAEAVVAADEAAKIGARASVARAPFGAEPEPEAAPAPEPKTRKPRRTPWAACVGYFRSFSDEPESYHSDLARDPLPHDPRGEHLVATPPGNYGHAMFVVLAAVGLVVGAYLPWISGTIGLAKFHRSGFDNGLGLGYTIGAISLAISALLSVRMRAVRWVTIVLSFVIAGFVVRDVLHSYEVMQDMNRFRSIDADVGWGLWIMIVAVAIAMIAAVRLSEDEKYV